MLFRIGLFIVLASIIIGYLGAGGNISVILQPFEWLVILGSGIGSFIISNPRSIQVAVRKSMSKLVKGTPYRKKDYIYLLTFLFIFFRKANISSLAELEQHIESPSDSSIFQEFPTILRNKEFVTFFCDFFRIIILGFDNIHELDNMMEYNLSEKEGHLKQVATALQKLGESLPGLGIVAAVLGVIVAMGAVGSDPAILGGKIASALVGTLAGVGLSYCFVTPVACFLDTYGEDEIKFLKCLRIAMISYANGYPPSIAVEFARQIAPIAAQPTFYELESAINAYSNPIASVSK